MCKITIYSVEDAFGKVTEKEMQDYAYEFIDDAFSQCTLLENVLSKTISDSKLSELNRSDAEDGIWVDTGLEVSSLIEKAQKYSELSDGKFDVTIGSVSELWDFHGDLDDNSGVLPDDDKIKEALAHVGYTNIETRSNGTARKLDKDTEVDLGGIAKGYIADSIADYMYEQGVRSAIINFGGNIVAIGRHAKRFDEYGSIESDFTDYKIGINDPLSETGDILGYFEASDATIVTSGTYERFIEVGGKKYHHILDPKTGYPVDTDLIQVSVLAPRGMSADADCLTTTLLALGSDEGMKLMNKLASDPEYKGVEAVFLTNDGDVLFSNPNTAFVKNEG